MTQIAARGYYLFTGSARLLDGRVTHSCDKKRGAVDLKTQTPFPVAELSSPATSEPATGTN